MQKKNLRISNVRSKQDNKSPQFSADELFLGCKINFNSQSNTFMVILHPYNALVPHAVHLGTWVQSFGNVMHSRNLLLGRAYEQQLQALKCTSNTPQVSHDQIPE